MSRTETDAFHHSHVRSRMYQLAAMLVHDIAAMLAKNAGAVPLIHGPAGCASLRQMDSFDVSGRVPHAPCMNISEIDLDPVAIHHEYVDFQSIDFDYGGHDVFVYPLLAES